MSVDWLHHYLLSTTDVLPKNIARKEQPFVWGEEYESSPEEASKSDKKIMESYLARKLAFR